MPEFGPALLDRVVIVNDDCAASGGAAAIAVAGARLLRQRQIPVTFISGDGGSNPELAELGVEMVGLDARHILDGPRAAAAVRGIYNAKTLAGIDAWMAARETGRTVYHLHNWHKVLSPSVFRALRRAGPRLLISAHDYFLACPNGGYFHYPRRRPCDLVPAGMSCVLTSCDRRHYGHKLWRLARHRTRQWLLDLAGTQASVLAVHPRMVAHLERGGIHPRAIRVLRNPVSPWRSRRVPAERNREAYFVGRLEHDKGAELLAIAARSAGVPLTLIGEGRLARAIARAHPQARLLGWQPREKIAELIGRARMLVVPTPSGETFGLVAAEALMSGVPIIISGTSLISEEIVLHGFGLACDPGDGDALAAAIGRLATDDVLAAKISRLAFAGARSLAPAPEEWCDELVAIYTSAVRSAQTGAGPAAGAA